VRGNVFEKLSGLWIPSAIMRIDELTAVQKMIVAMAANFRNGLRMSNNDLAALLGIDRRNVIYNIQRLRNREYLLDAGPDEQHRILKANSDKLPLLSSDKSSPEQAGGSDAIITTSSDTSITSLPQSSDASITHKQRRANKLSNKEEYSPNSTEFGLSKLLLDLILSRKPDFRKPNLQTWAGEINRMLRLDGRKPERIEAVIRWCQSDVGNGNGWSGWQNNILSTEKLRQKFDKLELSMEKKNGRTKENRGHNRQFATDPNAITI
jgi:DNA-binding Lrp family transcriptional regulator